MSTSVYVAAELADLPGYFGEKCRILALFSHFWRPKTHPPADFFYISRQIVPIWIAYSPQWPQHNIGTYLLCISYLYMYVCTLYKYIVHSVTCGDKFPKYTFFNTCVVIISHNLRILITRFANSDLRASVRNVFYQLHEHLSSVVQHTHQAHHQR